MTKDDIWIDLADRENDGLEVTLLWSATAGRARVAVFDAKRGEGSEFDVAAADALAAFHHPFAYAPDSGFPGASAPVSNDLQVQL
jgi:hypothetical protein